MATLIKNGLLYDGTGHPPIKADVLFRGGKIEKIGTIPPREARVVVDAMGGIVTPGFIDIGVRMDDYQIIFSDRHASSLLARGITTVIGGAYGESLAPFSAACVNKKLHFRCTHPASRDWGETGEFFEFLERYRPPLNFGSLAGYHTVRNCTVRNLEGDPDREEQKAIFRALSEALDAGAFGVSFDMRAPHALLMPKRMFAEIAELVGTRGGILFITAEEGVSSGKTILDAHALSEKRGVSVEIGRLSASSSEETEEFAKALAKLEKKKSTVAVHFDVGIEGEWREEPFVKLFPAWAREKSMEAMLAPMRLASHRARLASHFAASLPTGTLIGEVPSNLSFLRGKSLSAVAENHGKSPSETFVRLLLLSGLEGTCMIPEGANIGFLASALRSPLSLVSSHCASPYGEPKSLIFSAEGTGYPLENLVSKNTFRPAKKFRIPKRGLIKEGYFADIAVFGADARPARVFVNGNCAYADGGIAPSRAGHVLRRA